MLKLRYKNVWNLRMLSKLELSMIILKSQLRHLSTSLKHCMRKSYEIYDMDILISNKLILKYNNDIFIHAYFMISLKIPRGKDLNCVFSLFKYSLRRQFLFLHIYSLLKWYSNKSAKSACPLSTANSKQVLFSYKSYKTMEYTYIIFSHYISFILD
jgi:hypothetical protein